MKKLLFLLLTAFSSWLPRLASQITISAEDLTICSGGTVSVDISVLNFNDVTSMSFPINWNPAVLQYTGQTVTLPPIFGVNNANAPAGQLLFSWFDPTVPSTGLDLPNGTTIVTVHFNVIGNYVSNNFTAITLTGGGFPAEVYTVADINNPDPNAVFDPGTVTIADSQNPTFSGCPPTVTVMGQTATWTPPTASDNCMVASVTSNYSPGATFPPGTTTVTYTATDGAGNTGTCSFPVTVVGAQLTFIASNDTLGCGDTTVTVEVRTYNFSNVSGFQFGLAWDTSLLDFTNAVVSSTFPPSSTLNVDSANIGQLRFAWFDASPPLGDVTLPAGTLVLTLNFTLADLGVDSAGVTFSSFPTFFMLFLDQNGNTIPMNGVTLVNSEISIEPDDPPVFTSCPGNISVNATAGQCSAVVGWAVPVATDDCDNPPSVVRTQGAAPGSTFSVGTYTIIYVATDSLGQTDTCTFTVTVVDNQSPSITCPVSQTIANAVDLCSATATWTAPTPTDNCPGVTASSTNPPGSSFPVGMTTVTYTATDASNNQTTCTFTITVTDQQSPTLAPCPANITQSASPGVCQTIVTWTAPAATDNCTLVSNVPSIAPGSTFNVGTTTVTYTATDQVGNISTCSFTVTVEDDENPAITCPANVSVNNVLGQCSAPASWTAPTPTDNCPGVTASASIASGSTFNVGTTVVTYTATDAAGNTATCTFNVTVLDAEAPVIPGCPANISQSNDPGFCAAAVTWTAPMATDNCAVTSLTASPPSGSLFSVGTTTVTYTALDAAGNLTTCQFTVTVTDDEAPTITNCPDTILQGTDPGVCEAIVNWTLPLADDNCQLASFLSSHLQMDTFAIGATTVTYTATDTAGNVTVCAFEVIVGDDDAPVISGCPGDITMDNLAGQCTAKVVWIEPTSSDNCPGDTLTGSHVSGVLFNVGTTTVTYTATDAAGNTSICSFEVEVLDVEPPVYSGCPADTLVSADSSCQAVVFWTEPVANDNCPTISISRSHEPGDTFLIGTTTVLYIATDAAGNTDSCSFNITVADDAPPTISGCPGDISQGTDSSFCSAVVDWVEPLASDNCGLASFTSSHSPLDIFLTDTTTVTYTATDSAGNVSTCEFDVIIADDEPPVIAGCPADTLLIAEPDSCSAIANWSPLTVSDNCPGFTLVSNFDPGDRFPVDSTFVNYVATDAAGNTATCTFLVVVQDTVAPVFSNCPADITMPADSGVCSAVVTWVAPTVSDNCDVVLTNSHDPGDTFPVGTTTVTYHAEDEGWNQKTCSFNVTVTDDQFPAMACPIVDTLILPSGDTGVVVTGIGLVSLSDNCGVDSTWVTLAGATSGSDSSGSGTVDVSGTLFEEGTTTVTYFAEDEAGNVQSCSFEVVVLSTVPPEIICPVSVQTSNDAGDCSAVVMNLTPTFSPVDSLASLEFFATGATSQTGNDASGLAFEVGLTTVTYIAIDHSGDTATCVFTVEVADTESPVFTNCNGNDTVSTTNTLCGLLFSGNVLPVADDNCPGVVLTYLPAAGTTLTLGTTPISALATDSAGNQAICTYNITVLDDDAPMISGCPGNISVAAALGQCGANVNWIAPTATDNCQLLAFTPSQAPGSFFPAGNIPTPVEYVAVDNAGNVAKCMFTVTVSDQQPPVFVVCPTVPPVNASPGNCSAIVTWALPAVSDNCGVISLNGNQVPGSFDVGSTSATYTALDAAGNSATCNFTITVMDNQFPVFSGVPQDMTVLAEPGLCGATVNWNPPTATDNCGIISIGGSETPGSFFDAGTEVEVEYTAVDENGNVTVVSFTIEVLDVIPPVFNCPEDVTISTDGSISDDPSGVIISLQPIDCENIQLSFQQPSVTDDCGISSIVQTEGLASGSIFTTGTVGITFLATDNNGNPNTCHFDIVVEGVAATVAVDAFPSNPCEGDAVFFFVNDYPGATYEWKDPLGNVVATGSFFNLNNISALQSGMFTVEIDLPSNCTLTGFVDVIVNPNPQITATANDLLCTDGTGDIQLNGEVLNGAVVMEWVWVYPDQTFAFGQSQTISDAGIDDAGMYSVTAMTANGCLGFATVEVDVSLEPTMPSLFGSDNAVCVGDQVVLDGQAFSGNEVEYHWFATPSQGSGLIPFSNDGLTVEPSEPGTFTYSYFVVVDGCSSDTAVWMINVQAAPSLSPSYSGVLTCVDGTTSITLLAGGSGATSWEWVGLSTLFTSNEENPEIPNATSDDSDIYQVTATTTNGCSSTAAIGLDITDAPPAPTLVASQDSICLGGSITLSATPGYGQGAGFTWTGNNLPPFAPTVQNLQVTPDATGTLTYTFSALVNDCPTAVATTTILVEAAPLVGISVQGQTICVDSNSVVTLVGNAPGATSFEWRRTPNGQVISTDKDLVLTGVSADDSGTYFLTAKTGLGCTGSGSFELTISEALPPLLATIDGNACEEGNLTLCAALLIDATYSWAGPSGTFATTQCVTIPNATIGLNGIYTVTAFKDGCQATGSVEVSLLPPPDALAETVLVFFDQPQGFDVVANDSLVEGKDFTIKILENPTKGTVVYDGNGVFTYTAFPGFSESDHMTYEICYTDCPDLCDIAFVTFLVRPEPSKCLITSLISPNDDGTNDALVVSCLDVPNAEPCPLNRIVIFNQWGDKVFEAQPYNNDWQGTYEGKHLPDGTYFYIFECDPDLPAQKGFVMIYR